MLFLSRGVDETTRDLMQMLDLSALSSDAWRPPIVPTIATSGDGVDALWQAVLDHREFVQDSGELARRRDRRLREELREIIAQRLGQRARELCTGDRWEQLTADVVGRSTDPWSAADEMLHAVDA